MSKYFFMDKHILLTNLGLFYRICNCQCSIASHLQRNQAKEPEESIVPPCRAIFTGTFSDVFMPEGILARRGWFGGVFVPGRSHGGAGDDPTCETTPLRPLPAGTCERPNYSWP